MNLIIKRRMIALAAARCNGNGGVRSAFHKLLLGGTGKYMDAHGQLASTRNADGSYTQVFTLIS